jgi:DNA-binding NtrC family response regulator
MGRILVVDDEPDVRSVLRRYLSRAGHDVEECLDGLSAIERVRDNQIDLALLDVCLPRLSGLEVARRLKRERPHVKVIMMSAYLDVEATEKAVKCGADKVLPKPCDMDRLGQAIERLLSKCAPGPRIVAESQEMLQVLARLDRLASTNLGVLLVGETGTGKELLARRLHEVSPRRDHSYVKVDCAALPESLLENELFGHEANAFTDGTEARMGRVPSADGGTLFLDEVANLSPAAQAKLLRVLSEGEVQRLGAPHPVPVDVRVVAATNVPLLERVEEGHFREDLYYRLAETLVQVPPLRERPSDVAPLAMYFLEEFRREYGTGPRRLDHGALAAAVAARWPGNVRQLRSVVREAALFAVGEAVDAGTFLEVLHGRAACGKRDAHLSVASGHLGLRQTVQRVVTELETDLILQALNACGWNRVRAAQVLRVDYKTLLTKMRKCNIVPGVGHRVPAAGAFE